jgi:CHAD domain-containing protein
MQGVLPSADPPMRAVRAVLLAQLDQAIFRLERRNPSDHAVHEVRKELKRARATLRLLRECIGPKAYHRENGLLRDAARPLAAVRDAKILVEALQRLDPKASKQRRPTFARHLYNTLRRERRDVQRQLRPQELAAAAAALRAVKRRVGGVSAQRLDRAALDSGLERAYKAGRKAFVRVKRSPADDRLHEWRKRTKYFSNQLEIVLPLNPKLFAKHCKRSQRLAQQLGDDHDLALLNDKIVQYAKRLDAAGQGDAAELTSRVARERRKLQRKAYRLGKQLYSRHGGRSAAGLGREVAAAAAIKTRRGDVG